MSISETQTVQHVDPRTLVPSVRNTRDDLGDLTEITASIAANGVLEPLVVAHGDDGQTIILAGHRRTAAAIEAGAETVPVIYRDDLAGDIEQLTVVLSENLHRQGLTDAEVVRAVQQMIDLGESGASIARRTGIAKARTTRLARVARSSDEVRTAVTEHNLTLDQALALDQVKDDPEAVAELLEWLDHPGEFDAVARRQQAERKVANELATALDAYAADGITAYSDEDENRPETIRLTDIYGWDQDADERTAAHADCPGRAVVLSVNIWQQRVRAEERCADPQQHSDYFAAEQERAERMAQYQQRAHQTQDDPEAKKAERRRVVANNKAMDAANAHRLAWLAAFLKAKQPALGKAAATLVARLYSDRLSLISGLTAHRLDDELQQIGWKHGAPADRAQPGTAHGYLFAIIAAGTEKHTNRETWRHPENARQHAAWVSVLMPLGYQPTGIEQAMIDGTINEYVDAG